MEGMSLLHYLSLSTELSCNSPSPIVNTMCPGVCKSDLGRQYSEKGILMSVAVSFFSTAVAKSTESGARTMILAAMTGPEEHGKYIKHYGTEEEYAEYDYASPTRKEAKKRG